MVLRLNSLIMSLKTERQLIRAKKLVKKGKFDKAKEIYKDSNGLDNISAHMMEQFNQIMLGGRQ